MELREGSVGVIDQALMSHTFETIMEGYNDKMYLAWQDGDYTLAPGPVFVPQGDLECRALTISPGNYNINNMAAHLQQVLRVAADDSSLLCMVHGSGNRLFFHNSFRLTKSETTLF